MSLLEDLQRRTQLLLERVDESGVLTLNLSDIRVGAAFESAQPHDIRISIRPIEKARCVILIDGDRTRVLLDKRPPQRKLKRKTNAYSGPPARTDCEVYLQSRSIPPTHSERGTSRRNCWSGSYSGHQRQQNSGWLSRQSSIPNLQSS